MFAVSLIDEELNALKEKFSEYSGVLYTKLTFQGKCL